MNAISAGAGGHAIVGGRGSARTPVYSLAYCIRGAVAGGGGAEACNGRSVDHCCFVCFH